MSGGQDDSEDFPPDRVPASICGPRDNLRKFSGSSGFHILSIKSGLCFFMVGPGGGSRSPGFGPPTSLFDATPPWSGQAGAGRRPHQVVPEIPAVHTLLKRYNCAYRGASKRVSVWRYKWFIIWCIRIHNTYHIYITSDYLRTGYIPTLYYLRTNMWVYKIYAWNIFAIMQLKLFT